MNYSQSLRYLDSFLNFEKMTLSSSPKWNVKRMKFLLALAGHPEKSFFPVLIAGTKGKGSTGFMLDSILNASGTASGFYSSPHLETPRERIRLKGKMISEQLWCEELEKIKKLLSRVILRTKSEESRSFALLRMTSERKLKLLSEVTYFEIMTLLAALVFKRAGLQVGIFEAGMGGRYDAVNAMDAQLVILTPIHLDHEAVLGNTIAKIAAEKAAIIRSGAQGIVSPQVQEALTVIRHVIKKKSAQGHFVVKRTPGVGMKVDTLIPGLKGDYQQVNMASAIQASGVLRADFGFRVTPEGVVNGTQAQGWPGRFEVFRRKGADWVLDAAHNPISIEALVRNLRQGYANRPRTLIFGTSRDKNAAAMLKTLGRYFKEVLLTRAENSRSAEIPILMTYAKKNFERIYPFASVADAMAFAESKSGAKSLITVTGSFYVIAEARRKVKS